MTKHELKDKHMNMPLHEVWTHTRPLAEAEFKMQLGLRGHVADRESLKQVPAHEMEIIAKALDLFNQRLFDEINLWDHPELSASHLAKTDSQPF